MKDSDEAKREIGEVIKKAFANPRNGMCYILAVNTDECLAKDVGDSIREELDKRKSLPPLALQFKTDIPPWNNESIKKFAAEFVEANSDLMVYFMDEASFPPCVMFGFPGFGMLRTLALAGYGEFSEDPDGVMGCRLDARGRAFADALRGEGVEC